MEANLSAENDTSLKSRVQIFIVCGSIILLIAKFIAFFVTNSVAIFTDAMESIVNVLAGLVSLYCIYRASRPKDVDHPFGHGKIELLSASLEAMMIIVAGALIIFEAVNRFFNAQELANLDFGIAIVALSGLANFIMGQISVNIGRKHDSIALIASGKHLKSDTYSTIGLVLGLIAVRLTGYLWLDCTLAIIFGFLILFAGLGILKNTIANLTDKADEESLKKMLTAINQNMRDDWINIHNLKIIKYGSNYYVDCDLTLPKFYNISEGHRAYDKLKAAMHENFSDKMILSIHFDPCNDKQCKFCKMQNCPVRSAQFEHKELLTINNMTEVELH